MGVNSCKMRRAHRWTVLVILGIFCIGSSVDSSAPEGIEDDNEGLDPEELEYLAGLSEQEIHEEVLIMEDELMKQGYTLEEIYDNDPELLANKSLVDLDDEEVEDELMKQGYNLEEIYDNDPELLGIENLEDLDDLAELDLEEDLEAGDMVNGDSLDILNAVEGEPEPTVSRLAREAAKKKRKKKNGKKVKKTKKGKRKGAKKGKKNGAKRGKRKGTKKRKNKKSKNGKKNRGSKKKINKFKKKKKGKKFKKTKKTKKGKKDKNINKKKKWRKQTKIKNLLIF